MTSPDPNLLPKRTQQVLQALSQAIEATGYPPSLRELGKEVGLRSPSSIKHQLDLLEEAGFITRRSSRPRAIEVVGRAKPEKKNRAGPGTGGKLRGRHSN